MNRDDKFVKQLEAYLAEYEGSTPLPDSIRAEVRAQLPRTTQIRPLPGLSRYPAMKFNVPVALGLGLVAAVTVVAAFLALSDPRPGPSVGGPSGQTTQPSSLAPTPIAVSPIPGFALEPGRSYRVGAPFEVPFTVSFPSPWRVRTLAPGDATFLRREPAEGAPDVSVMLVENVFEDPCRDTEPRIPPVPRTVEGIVEGLRSLVGFASTNVSEVNLAGHDGTYLELTNSIDTATAGCAGGPMLPLFTIRKGEPPATNSGLVHRIWVIDVDGTVVLIAGWDGAGRSTQFASEVESVIRSIRFE